MNLFALMLASKQTIFAKTTHKESQISKKSLVFDELLQLFERQSFQENLTFYTQKDTFWQHTSKDQPNQSYPVKDQINQFYPVYKNGLPFNNKYINPYKNDKTNDNLQHSKVKEDQVALNKSNAKRVFDHHTSKKSQFLGSIRRSTNSSSFHRPSLKSDSLPQAKNTADFFKKPGKKVDVSKTVPLFIDYHVIEHLKTLNYSIKDRFKDKKVQKIEQKLPKSLATHIKEAFNQSNATRRVLSKINTEAPVLKGEGNISKKRQIDLVYQRELRPKELFSLDGLVVQNKEVKEGVNKEVKEVETKLESFSKHLAQTEPIGKIITTVADRAAKSVINSVNLVDIKNEDKIVDLKTIDRRAPNKSVKIVKEELDGRQNFDVQKQSIQSVLYSHNREPLLVDRSYHIPTPMSLHLDPMSIKTNRSKNYSVTNVTKSEDFVDEQHPIFANYEEKTSRSENVSPVTKTQHFTAVEFDHQKPMDSEYHQDEIVSEELIGTPHEPNHFQEFENRFQEQNRRHYKLNLGDTRINISYNKSQLHLQFITNSNYFVMDGMEHYIEHVMSEHSFDDYEVKLKDREKSLIIRAKKDGVSSTGPRSMIDVKA